jgi:hypothetical protein
MNVTLVTGSIMMRIVAYHVRVAHRRLRSV